MRIETNRDLEVAVARLTSRTPEVLAAFITSLALETGPIGEQVRTFIVGDNLPEAEASVKKRIDALRNVPRSPSRYRDSGQLGERIGYIVHSIETLVLPVSPAAAFALLVLLFERDGDAMEQCGDDDWSVQMELERAASLVTTVLKSLPGREAIQTVERLVAKDEYRTRAVLEKVLANLSR